MRPHWKLYLCAFVLASGLSVLPAAAQDLGPLVELSRPNAVGSCNTGFNAFGTFPTDDAIEPFVAVNPAHPNNFVATWMQGPAQDVIGAASFDGGQSWQQVPLPLTVCTGGTYLGSGDPWLSFAPNGDLYAINLGLPKNSPTPRVVLVNKSSDGGLHWSAAAAIPGSDTLDAPPDRTSITADPTNAMLVYAIWDGFPSPHSGSGMFSRSINGGLTWEPARAIVQTGSQRYVFASRILVLPNGTLVDLYDFQVQQPNAPPTFTNVQVLRSTDQGQTWSAPINAVTMTPLFLPKVGNDDLLLVDPDTGQVVRDATNPQFGVDSKNGNLYAVWEDGRFSNFQYNEIAFSMSADGGFTWSAPIRVNQTPTNIPPLDRQAFFPSIAVAANGTMGVSYYDFRFNDPSAGLPTDRWLAQCSPSSNVPAANPACWNNEVRLTDSSFNMEAVVPYFFGIFLGDYFGLSASGDGFVNTFTAVDSQSITSIFARRVGP